MEGGLVFASRPLGNLSTAIYGDIGAAVFASFASLAAAAAAMHHLPPPLPDPTGSSHQIMKTQLFVEAPTPYRQLIS